MKFTVRRESFIDSLKGIATLCSKKMSFTICNCCLIKCHDGNVDIVGTDVETMAAKAGVDDAVVVEDGCVCVDAKHLYSIISDLPKGVDVELETDKTRLTLTTERFRSSIPTRDVEDFPTVRFNEDEKHVTIAASELRAALSGTVKAASKDNSRPVFLGSQVQVLDGQLEIAATDGHRLSWYEFDSEREDEGIERFIIPVAAQQHLLNTLRDGEVTIGTDTSNKMIVQYGKTLLSIVGIAGQFPNFRQVLPRELDINYSAEISKSGLIEALKQVENVLCVEKGRETAAHLVVCNFSESKLNFTARTQTLGEISNWLEVCGKGKEITVGLNAGYILEAVSTIPDDTIRVSIVDAESPVLFVGAGDSRLKHIIMTIQL